MCGIIGYFSKTPIPQHKIKKAVESIKARGGDAVGVTDFKKARHYKNIPKKFPQKKAMIHLLHTAVSFVPQPLKGKGFFAANCTIYNWKTLEETRKIRARNDAELAFKLFEQTPWFFLRRTALELGEDFAIAYYRGGKIFLARDVFGIKPLFFSFKSNGFAFASEPKALRALGFHNISELNPRQHLVVGEKKLKKHFLEQRVFEDILENSNSLEKNTQLLQTFFLSSLKKRLTAKKCAVLFSGGIDSIILAQGLKKFGKKPELFIGIAGDKKNSKDLAFARKAAGRLGLKLHECVLEEKEIPGALKEIVEIIESTDPIKVGVSLSLLPCFRELHKKKFKMAYSGLGADELFGGYARHSSGSSLNKDCLNYVLNAFERDLFRDNALGARCVGMAFPFYDFVFALFSLSIPPEQKVVGARRKIVLREMAKKLGVPKKFAERKKLAAQYGSGASKAIQNLAKKQNLTQSRYLARFAKKKNEKLAVLWSTGKDSCWAMHVMNEKNYEIACLVSIASKNPDSFMFHTPNVAKMARLQSKALGIPLVLKKSCGEKEKELADLKKALAEAKNKFNFTGIVSGALCSNYQRSRIQKIADSLNLKNYIPLWHCSQEKEFRKMLSAGFEIVFAGIAAQGLDKKWLGKAITQKDVDNLVALDRKATLNIAGEGGEFETLVLKAPMFKKRLNLKQIKIKSQNPFTAALVVEKAVLE